MYIFTFTCKHFTYIFRTFLLTLYPPLVSPLSASSVYPLQCPPSVLPHWSTSVPLLCPFSIPLSVPPKCPLGVPSQCPPQYPLQWPFLNRGRRQIFLAPKGLLGQHLSIMLDFVIDGWYGLQAFSIHCIVNEWLYRTNLHLAPNSYFVIGGTLTIYWIGDGGRHC